MNIIKRQVKKYFKSNPALFWLWYVLYRKKTGVSVKWFSKDTALYFDGFPRSGNTFAQHLICRLWLDLDFVHHFHAIASIKIALNNKIPTFVLVREPFDAITSYYLKEYVLQGKDIAIGEEINIHLLKTITLEYLQYYTWVNAHEQKINIVLFDDLINRPEVTMQQVNSFLPKDLQLNPKRIKDHVVISKDQSFGNKDKYGASLPNAAKEKAKSDLKEVLMLIPQIGRCQMIFQKLSTKVIS